jgi:hypothetical protein
MTAKSEIAGRRFGKLVAIEEVATRLVKGRSYRYFRCRCDCGSEKEILGWHLSSGHTISCGCANRGNTRHLDYNSPEYISWCSMKTRCNNAAASNYSYYGGRGIKICERWEDYTSFLADMGRKPSPSHTLDRIDNSGDYTPGNCRWATKTEQSRNQRPKRKRHAEPKAPS